MAKSGRDLGREILDGIRQLKRGESGRIAVVPRRLFTIRGLRVILDSDLAKLSNPAPGGVADPLDRFSR